MESKLKAAQDYVGEMPTYEELKQFYIYLYELLDTGWRIKS